MHEFSKHSTLRSTTGKMLASLFPRGWRQMAWQSRTAGHRSTVIAIGRVVRAALGSLTEGSRSTPTWTVAPELATLPLETVDAIGRGMDRQPEVDTSPYRSDRRTTLGLPRTERSIFRILRESTAALDRTINNEEDVAQAAR